MADITTDDGFSISSNTETADAMHAAVAVPDDAAEDSEDPKASEAGKPVDTSETLPSEPSPVSAVPPGTEKRRNRREDPQEAIKVAVAKEREAERRAQAAERERDELRARLAPPPPRAAPPTSGDDDPEPMYVQGQAPDEFVRQHSRWSARQEVKAVFKQRALEEQAAARQQADIVRSQPFLAKMAEITVSDPTFATKLHPDVIALDMRERTPITDAIIDSADPKAVLQYLSDHPQDFQRLATLHPYHAIREMARLEERLAAGPGSATAPPVLSNAKPPIPALGGSPHSSDANVDEADLPVEEFIRRANRNDPRRTLTPRRR